MPHFVAGLHGPVNLDHVAQVRPDSRAEGVDMWRYALRSDTGAVLDYVQRPIGHPLADEFAPVVPAPPGSQAWVLSVDPNLPYPPTEADLASRPALVVAWRLTSRRRTPVLFEDPAPGEQIAVALAGNMVALLGGAVFDSLNACRREVVRLASDGWQAREQLRREETHRRIAAGNGAAGEAGP